MNKRVCFVMGVTLALFIFSAFQVFAASDTSGTDQFDVAAAQGEQGAIAGQSQTLPSYGLEPGVIGEGASYTLGKGDIVQVVVRGQPEFSGELIIGPDGNIQYQFIGDIKAEGLTKDELKEKLTKELAKYVEVPEVSVVITAYQSKFVYIIGDVGRPGKYHMRGDRISLRDAIVQAGLPTPDAALRRVYIIKPDTTKPVYKKVDLFKILYRGILKENVMLIPGDLVVVPSTIPSEINKALGRLLSPITRAVIVQDLFNPNR